MILDLFAGPGGWDVGLGMLGRSDVIGIEWDKAACDTRRAAGHKTIRADLANLPIPSVEIEGLIASPPCQSFSMAGDGKGRDELASIVATVYGKTATIVDPRAKLVLEPLKWAEQLRPMWIAWEQVPPVLEVWKACAWRLKNIGYSVWTGLLRAEQYGVPQTRTRAVLMAHKRKYATPPTPTHQRYGPGIPAQQQDGLFGTLKPWVSMAEALGWGMSERPYLTVATEGGKRGGPDEQVGGSKARERLYAERDQGRWVIDRRTNSKDGKGGMAPSATVPIERPAPTLTSRTGGQWVLRHGSLPKSAERTPDQPAATMLFGHCMNDVSWTEKRPSTTVCGDPRIAPAGHHDHHVAGSIRLSIEEALILQGFRPDYPLQGSRTSQFGQVGNAIPVGLARAILGALI